MVCESTARQPVIHHDAYNPAHVLQTQVPCPKDLRLATNMHMSLLQAVLSTAAVPTLQSLQFRLLCLCLS